MHDWHPALQQQVRTLVRQFLAGGEAWIGIAGIAFLGAGGPQRTGTLTIGNLRPGRTLWLLATGTGLAPFLSVIKDPETYDRFERVVLTHTCRRAQDLAYARYIAHDLLACLRTG